MPKFSRLLCFLLLLLLIFLIEVAVGGVDDGFVYSGFSSSSSNLVLDGAAYIGEDGILTLTNSTEYNAHGHCFLPQPVALFNSSSKERYIRTLFIFSITPGNLSSISGQGMDKTSSMLPPGTGTRYTRTSSLWSSTASIGWTTFGLILIA